MDLLESVELICRFSQLFGIFPNKMQKINGKITISESNLMTVYSQITIVYAFTLGFYSVYFTLKNPNYYFDSYWTKISFYLDFFSSIINYIAIPVLLCYYRKVICRNLNDLNNIGKLQIFEGKINQLKIGHNFVLLIYLILILTNNIYDALTNGIATQFGLSPEKQFAILFFTLGPVTVLSLFAVQFFSFVNIVRSVYVQMNKLLLSHSVKKLQCKTLKTLIKVDDVLKDFLDDIESAYSFCILLFVFQAFISTVDGIFLFVTHKLEERSSNFFHWIAYHFCFLISTTTICRMTITEVK